MASPPPDPRQLNRLLLAAFAGLVLLIAWNVAFAQALPQGTVLDPRELVTTSQRAIGRTIGDHAMVDSRGQPFRLSQFRGKPLIVSFIYTGCFQVCPTTTRFLAGAVAEARKAVGADSFQVLTVGFNLPFDSPTAMREFKRRQGIEASNWEFLAVDAPTLDALARDVGFVWTPTPGGFDHLTQATIVDAQGRVVRQVYGESFELPMLVGPLRELATGAPARVTSALRTSTKTSPN